MNTNTDKNTHESTETADPLQFWIDSAPDLNRGVHFSWLGKSYKDGIGLITATENGGEVVDFEVYILSDIPVFRRSYARSCLYYDGTHKGEAVKTLFRRLQNTTDANEEKSLDLTFRCGQLLDRMLSVTNDAKM